MDDFLQEKRCNFIAREDKNFIRAFNLAMSSLGYDFGDKIGSGYCWGKYMLIYTRSGVKSKKVFARIYIQNETIVLRLFLNDIDKHRQYIENAPPHIKQVFAGEHAACRHCHNDHEGVCRFRKIYTLDDRLLEKCNGVTFEFHHPMVPKLPDYMALFTEFYPKKSGQQTGCSLSRSLLPPTGSPRRKAVLLII